MSLAARKIRLIMKLRRSGITSTAVLAAIERVPREIFVPRPFLDQAYEDRALPIGHGQTLSQPQVVAIMTQALDVKPTHRVLEIGTGSGYQAAVLSLLAQEVYTIERYAALLEEALTRIGELGLRNIHARVGDGNQGWPEAAPFDRIMLTAAAASIPQALLEQLAPGGIMVVPVGPERGDQELVRLTKTADGIHEESLAPVRFVPLLSGTVTAAEATAPDFAAGPDDSGLS
ncbi:MAG: protein-L-isoaspartate(D-aspartate) O-methyltransferase [Dongiaceae bacterium]